ncbi:hypothetical protein [Pseudoalteromonas luteoviolacea]|uniref:hypothetical protein n=1 Tax=Pseudoalteromonas luteoviolacea TaxID=43657 RepID=UPI001B399B67|nr:hypothetical protein [Pseudoalteromonas luteoviolacea]MBQ4834792.1 hypothetical protein [Pseudoalteromonas luteoviolacea]
MRSLSFFVLFLAGCASTEEGVDVFWDKKLVRTYEHPTYGIVKGDDPRLIDDTEFCREKVYKTGVLVDGEVVFGQKRLNKTLSDYKFKYVKESIKDYRKMPENSEIQDIANTYVESEPSYMSDIRKKQKSFVSCIRIEKGYKLLKTDFINPETGIVEETIKH